MDGARVDPDDPIVRLCAEGMQAEAAGRDGDAKALFGRAWEEAADDYERCVAAHYVARHQDGADATLHWNRECLRYAESVDDERVAGFYPSLHLNIGYCLEQLGDLAGAMESYRAAEARLADLPEGPYGEMIRDGVARGMARVDAARSQG